jgi:hypothetical protein
MIDHGLPYCKKNEINYFVIIFASLVGNSFLILILIIHNNSIHAYG